MTLEVASDQNRLATAQAKLGNRQASLANHTRAVTTTRVLREANADNVELTVALALALGGRADALLTFARKLAVPFDAHRRSRRCGARLRRVGGAPDQAASDPAPSTGRTCTTLENHRKELARIQSERSPTTSRR